MENNEKVLLVGANINDNSDFLSSMIELASLADALDIEVVNSFSQNLKEITSNFYIGSGKVREIRNYLKDLKQLHMIQDGYQFYQAYIHLKFLRNQHIVQMLFFLI